MPYYQARFRHQQPLEQYALLKTILLQNHPDIDNTHSDLLPVPLRYAAAQPWDEFYSFVFGKSPS